MKDKHNGALLSQFYTKKSGDVILLSYKPEYVIHKFDFFSVGIYGTHIFFFFGLWCSVLDFSNLNITLFHINLFVSLYVKYNFSFGFIGTLARLSRVEWDIDTEGPKVQSEFASFINAALIDLKRSRDEQEITILKE